MARKSIEINLSSKLNEKAIYKFVLVVLWIAILVSGFWAFNIYQEIQWPSVKALIVKNEISDEYGEYKYLTLSYQYKVGSETFLSKERIGQFKSPKLDQLRARYKENSFVDLAYNPIDPKNCALKTKNNPTVLNIVLTMIGVFFLANLFCVWKLSEKKK